MTARRLAILVIAGGLISLSPFDWASCRTPFTPLHAWAEENWKEELAALCGKSNDAMGMSIEELKALISGCDKLKPIIEAQDESTRKVYGKRLKMCRELYVYVLESKEQKKP
jgi:hypothetical protein